MLSDRGAQLSESERTVIEYGKENLNPIFHASLVPENNLEEKKKNSAIKSMQDLVHKGTFVGNPLKLVPAHVCLITSNCSLLFYLSMGWIPEDYQINYLDHAYGLGTRNSIKKLTHSKTQPTLEEFNSMDDWTRSVVFRILKSEKQINQDQATFEDVLNHFTYLQNLVTKRVNYVSNKFIPDLIDELNRSSKPYWPLAPMMVLSKLGRERWEEAIENKIPFSSFKKFEHLPYADKSQQEKLIRALFLYKTTLRVQAISVAAFQDMTSEQTIKQHKGHLLKQSRLLVKGIKDRNQKLDFIYKSKITEIRKAAQGQLETIKKAQLDNINQKTLSPHISKSMFATHSEKHVEVSEVNTNTTPYLQKRL
ncbi:MAG: hypothetical protein JO131_08065 [Gammaproteobacteria bacterium]|nr:hypothetical protein [Gammaproteobacteria bacterium]